MEETATQGEFWARVKTRRDIRENWEKNNPIPLDGEVILVEDGGTLRQKVGDGAHTYKMLPWGLKMAVYVAITPGEPFTVHLKLKHLGDITKYQRLVFTITDADVVNPDVEGVIAQKSWPDTAEYVEAETFALTLTAEETANISAGTMLKIDTVCGYMEGVSEFYGVTAGPAYLGVEESPNV